MNSPIRGIRNNNPFNIKKSDSPWLGKIVGKDPTFETFDSIEHGIRAGLKLLTNYIKHGYTTPKAIISRFAPASENRTSAYIDYVCDGSSLLSPDVVITTPRQFFLLCVRIIRYECHLNVNQLQGYGCSYDSLRSIFYKYGLTFK